MSLDQATALHHQAEAAREQKNYQAAIDWYSQALLLFGQLGLPVKVSEMHAAQSILYRHLFDQTEDPTQKAIWKNEVEFQVAACLKIAQLASEQGDDSGLAMAFFNAAKSAELDKDFDQAVKLFEQAVHWMETAPPENNNRPAVRWDFKLKLALARTFNGEAGALDQVLAAIRALEADSGPDADYNVKAWVSGAYLRLAEHFETSDRELAKTYFAKAKNIIDQDQRLIVRRERLDKLAAQLA